MEEKIELLKKINTDNSRFILKIIESYKKNELALQDKINNSSIILNSSNNTNTNIIDLDRIWCKPYFYTKMRLKLDEIIKDFSEISYDEFSKDSKRICNKIVNTKIKKSFFKPDNTEDIVDFIRTLNDNNVEDKTFTFVAKELDEETLFKEEQIKKAIEVIKIKDRKKQASYIYDEIYDYLDRDFISNKYCDFINNKCVAQRHHTLYPMNRENGCCFMHISKCTHLHENGFCDVKCIACRLFSCPYLSKKGIGYWAGDFVLLKAFFSKEERKHLVFDFFQDKDVVLGKMFSRC